MNMILDKQNKEEKMVAAWLNFNNGMTYEIFCYIREAEAVCRHMVECRNFVFSKEYIQMTLEKFRKRKSLIKCLEPRIKYHSPMDIRIFSYKYTLKLVTTFY